MTIRQVLSVLVADTTDVLSVPEIAAARKPLSPASVPDRALFTPISLKPGRRARSERGRDHDVAATPRPTPNWERTQSHFQSAGSAHDIIRRQHLAELSAHTGRNVIVYYSGWLEKEFLIKQGLTGFDVNDSDKNGFMAVIHELDRDQGLDLLIHTPGGDVAATESIVDYLRSAFTDIRAIVPQIAMSAGTMIALACREVVMGKHSSLGLIAPQLGGHSAHGVVEEVATAKREIAADPSTMAFWQPIIAKYPTNFVGECAKAITAANEIVQGWLETGMFAAEPDPKSSGDKVMYELTHRALTLSHTRHICIEKAKDLGLKVVELEADRKLQDLVLRVHHSCIQTFNETAAIKIIESQKGIGSITAVRTSAG